MVNSGSFEPDVDRNEKGEFTKPNRVAESPHSVNSMHSVSGSLCENDFATQTADSLPVSQAIEPTATKTEYKCNMSQIEKWDTKCNLVGESIVKEDTSIGLEKSKLSDKCNLGNKNRTKISICCSVPLEKVQGVLEACSAFGNKKLSSSLSATNLDKEMCLYCDRSFTNPSLKQRHVDRYHTFKNNRRLSTRRQKLVAQSATRCMYCEQLNESECSLKELFRHLISNHSEKYFGCIDCQIRFQSYQAYESHMSKVHGVKLEVNKLTTDNNNTKGAKEIVDNLGKDLSRKTLYSRTKRKLKTKQSDGDKSVLENGSISNETQVTTAVAPEEKETKPRFIRSVKGKKVISTKVGLKQNPRVTRQQTKILENAKNTKRKLKIDKIENDNSSKYLQFYNPYSPIEFSFKYKRITDHSIDNIKISSMTFDDVFDKAFFNRVKCNIQENLSNFIDGKLLKTVESENRILSFQKTDFQTEDSIQSYGCKLSSNAVTPVASLLTDTQFGEDIESQIEYGSKPSKKKTTLVNNDVHYKYFTRRKYQAVLLENKQHRDLSKLDMWTQLAVKNRQQKIICEQKTDKEILEYKNSDEYKVKMQVEELDRILNKRGPLEDLKEEAIRSVALEKLNGTSTQNNLDTYFDVTMILDGLLNNLFPTETPLEILNENTTPRQTEITTVNEEVPKMLNLRRISTNAEAKCEKFDSDSSLELTGEWARSRIYLCASCGIKMPNVKMLLDHKNLFHEQVWCQHYEFVGNQGELYRHLSIPGLGKVGELESSGSKMWKRSEARTCTKCNKQFNCLGDLHRHVLECGGDWSWMLARKKYKYRPYGSKTRKKRRGLLKLLQNIREKKTEQVTEKRKTVVVKKFDGPRPKPSDADTIERMLANLPAKRVTRKIISLKDGFQKTIKNKLIAKSTAIPLKQQKKPPQVKATKVTKLNENGLKSKKRSPRILRSNSDPKLHKERTKYTKINKNMKRLPVKKLKNSSIKVDKKNKMSLDERIVLMNLAKKEKLTQKKTQLKMKKISLRKEKRTKKFLNDVKVDVVKENVNNLQPKEESSLNLDPKQPQPEEEIVKPLPKKRGRKKKVVVNLNTNKEDLATSLPNEKTTIDSVEEPINVEPVKINLEESTSMKKRRRTKKNVIKKAKNLIKSLKCISGKKKAKEKITKIVQVDGSSQNKSSGNKRFRKNKKINEPEEVLNETKNLDVADDNTKIPQDIVKVTPIEPALVETADNISSLPIQNHALPMPSKEIPNDVNSVVNNVLENIIANNTPEISEKTNEKPQLDEISEKQIEEVKTITTTASKPKGKIKKVRGLNDCIAMLTNKLLSPKPQDLLQNPLVAPTTVKEVLDVDEEVPIDLSVDSKLKNHTFDTFHNGDETKEDTSAPVVAGETTKVVETNGECEKQTSEDVELQIAPIVEANSLVVETKSPVVRANSPFVDMDSPVIELDSPVVEPKCPIVEVDSPVVRAKSPVVEVDSPVVEVDSPVAEVDSPVAEVDSQVAEVDSQVVEADSQVVEVNSAITETNSLIVDTTETNIADDQEKNVALSEENKKVTSLKEDNKARRSKKITKPKTKRAKVLNEFEKVNELKGDLMKIDEKEVLSFDFVNSGKENVKVNKLRTTKRKKAKNVKIEKKAKQTKRTAIEPAVVDKTENSVIITKTKEADSDDDLPLSEFAKKIKPDLLEESKVEDIVENCSKVEEVKEVVNASIPVVEPETLSQEIILQPENVKPIKPIKAKRKYQRRKPLNASAKKCDVKPVKPKPISSLSTEVYDFVSDVEDDIKPGAKITHVRKLETVEDKNQNKIHESSQGITLPKLVESELEESINFDSSSVSLETEVTNSSLERPSSTKPPPKPRGKIKLKKKSKGKLSIKDPNVFCEICNKTFIRPENLAKHKVTLTHIAKLSEIEAIEAQKVRDAENLEQTEEPKQPEELEEPKQPEELEQSQPEPEPELEPIIVPEIPELDEATNLSTSKDSLPSSIPECTQNALKLVEIINDVLSKPSINDFNRPDTFSEQMLSPEPEIKRCKSLGERKSFDSDKLEMFSPINSPSPLHVIDHNFISKIPTTADIIVEKQISLLENMIEDNRINFNSSTLASNDEYSNHSNSSGFSMLSSKQDDCPEITFTHNTNIITNLIKPALEGGNLIRETQYEEISEDSSSSHFRFEEQKSRKVLNRDEELFLECCSLLKSSSDMSDLSKKQLKSTQFLNNFGLKPLDELEWLEEKDLRKSRNFDYTPNNYISDAVAGNYYNDISYSNMSVLSKTDNFISQPPMFEDISAGSDYSSAKSTGFQSHFETISASGSSNDGFDKLEFFEGDSNEEKKEEECKSDDVAVVSEEKVAPVVENEKLENTKSSTPKLTQSFITNFVVPKKSKEEKKLITKGAMKVFEGIKVSIPKEGLNMSVVLNCSPVSKQLEMENKQQTATKPVKPTKAKTTLKKTLKSGLRGVGNKLGLKITKKKYLTQKIVEKKGHDVYDFEETQDNIDLFKSSPVLPVYQNFKNKLNDDADDPIVEDKKLTKTQKNGQNTKGAQSKKINMSKSLTKKKCMIMGRIFKNAAKPKATDDIKDIPNVDNSKIVEDYVLTCQNTQEKEHKLTEEEINVLFDSLLNEGKPKVTNEGEHEVTLNKTLEQKLKKIRHKKRQRTDSPSTSDEEFSIKKAPKRQNNKKSANNECVINLEQELKECIGVASRKSQRKCTSGKQNVLVEYWSSDESSFEVDENGTTIQTSKEGDSCNQIEALKVVEEKKKKFKKIVEDVDLSDNVVDEKRKKIKSPVVSDSVEIVEKPLLKVLNGKKSPLLAAGRQKRNAVDTLYYWSSSSDDEAQNIIEVKPVREDYNEDDRPLQHGWIVGDSPKKLVTMLAHAKGKKLDAECVKRNKRKNTSA